MAIKTDTFASSAAAGTDNLDDVTSRGATTTNAITVGGVIVGTEYSLPTADGSADQVLKTDGNGSLSFTTINVTGGLQYIGTFNATTGLPSLANAEKGDYYKIATGGTIYGQTWDVNDSLLINEDMGGTITNSKIDKIDNTEPTNVLITTNNLSDLDNASTARTNLGLGSAATSASTDFLQVSNNLSDLNNASTARTNLGLGTAATADTGTDIGDVVVLQDVGSVAKLPAVDGSQLTNITATSTDTLDDVTTRGATTTNAITVGGVTTSGDILADADDSRTIGAEATRFITYHGDMNGAIRFKAKNNQGSAITKGQAVYISGVSGTVPEVKLAQANSALTMPAFGLALNNANDQAEVQIITFGNLTDYNTTTYSLSANDTVYVSATTAGALTNSAPTGESNLIQNIGRVVRADASAGIIKVGGAGRSNATPNLDQDKIFLGNASNQSVSTALNTIGLSKFNNDSGFLTDITSESLNDLSDVSFTAGAGIDNYVLTYDNTTSSWGAEVVPSAPVTSVNTQTGAVVVSGNDILADHTAVNYTAANNNVDGHFSGVDSKLGTLLADITSESLNDLSDVSFTAGAGIDNYVLTYDNATTSWGAEAVPSASPASETTAGIIEIATNAEAGAGTATDKALVPSNISSLDLSAMNNTTSAFISNITGESLNDLSDVSFTAGAGIDNYVLTYDHATTSWGAEAAAGGGEYTVSNQGSADFSASNNTFYYVNTASGTTTTVTLPGRTFSATNERIKFFNHGLGTLRVQETSGTARIHPDESGNDPGGSGQTYKDIGSRSIIEFIGIPNTYNWEWAISAQLELGKDTLSADGEVLRYNSSSDQMTALPYTFPTADGSANQILKTDGAGALTFIDQPSGTAPDVITDISGTNTTISTTTGIEEVHLISNGANNVAITIPAASTAGEGYKYQVKRLGTGTVSVAPSSGTIDGAASFSLASQYDSVTLVSDNSNWFII